MSSSPTAGASKAWLWPRELPFLTAVYLSIPFLLWSLTWLRAPWSLLLALFLIAALWKTRREISVRPDSDFPTSDVTTKHYFLVFLPLFFFSFFSGVGGFGPQSADWGKGNSVFADLVRFPWPVRYPEAAQPVHMTYYIGFYLPAAAIGKLLGWAAADFAFQGWCLIGMALLAGWLCLFCGTKAPWAGVLFIVFGGADWLGSQFLAILDQLHAGKLALGHVRSMGMPWSREWWVRRPYDWVYYANVTSMAWIPQQSLATWLGTCLLLRPFALQGQSDSSVDDTDAITFGLLPLWAPIGWLGCLPFGAYRVWLNIKGRKSWPSIPVSAASAACLLTIAGFLLTRIKLPTGVGVEPGPGYHLEFTMGRYLAQDGLAYVGTLLGFWLIEFAVLGALVYLLLRGQKDESGRHWRVLVALSMAYLAVLPFFHYGLFNDLMRSNLAATLVLAIASIKVLSSPSEARLKWARVGLCIMLGFGALHSALYAKEALRRVAKREVNARPHLARAPTLYKLYASDPRRQLLTQYMGPDDSWFANIFLKPR